VGDRCGGCANEGRNGFVRGALSFLPAGKAGVTFLCLSAVQSTLAGGGKQRKVKIKIIFGTKKGDYN